MTDRVEVITGLELCTAISQDGCMMLCPYRNEQDETYSGFCEQVLKRDALALLKEQPHWISVEKRLPKSMANKVIVYAEHEDLVSRIGYGHYERHKEGAVWYDLETHEPFINDGYTVTHWMRMPKSPDGEELILS